MIKAANVSVFIKEIRKNKGFKAKMECQITEF